MSRIVLIILLASTLLSGCGGSDTTVLVEDYPPISISYPVIGPFMIGNPIHPIVPQIEGGAPTDWAVSPDLPAGIVLDPETGVISGTPLEIQSPTPCTILAQNASGQVSVIVLLYVLPAPPCDIQYPVDSVQYLLGSESDPLLAEHGCGAAELWTISPQLPAGLTINPATGTISGTPVQVSPVTEYVITAANNVGENSVLLVIEVRATPPCDLLYQPAEITLLVGEELGTLEPDVGCGTVDGYSVDPSLPAGLSLDAATGVISGIAEQQTALAGYQITATNSSGSAVFSLQIAINPQAPCDLSYPTVVLVTELGESLSGMVPSVNCGPPASFAVDPELPEGLVLDPATGEISGAAETVYPPTIHTITASNVTGEVDFSMLIEVVAAPCQLTYSETELVLSVGIAMPELTPSTGCGSVESYQISPDLPPGMGLDPLSGVLSGTPLEASEATLYQITGSNSQGQSATLLLITVFPEAPCDLQYAAFEINLTVGDELAPLSPTFGCGAPVSFSTSTPLPGGLVIDPFTGVISGIASEAFAEGVIVVIATNGTGSTTFPLIVRVDHQAPCDLSYPSASVTLELDEALQPLIPSVGCGAVDNFSIAPPLPDGFAIDPVSGEISGSAVETYPQTSHVVTASNGSGAVDFSLLLEVIPPAPCNLSYSVTELVLAEGTPMAELVPTVDCGPVESYQVSPDLPPGIILDPLTGILSGTPIGSDPGTLFQIQAANSQGSSETLLLITVAPDAPCDLQYAPGEIALSVGEVLIPLNPSSGCGQVGQYTVSPALPSGLQLDASSGVILGVASEVAATAVYVVTAANPAGSSSFPLLIRIDPAAPCELSYPVSLLITEVEEILEPQVPTVGCGAADSFSIDPPLPPGLLLNASTGEISGVGLEVYPATIHIVEASNVTGQTTSSILIEIAPPPAPCELSYPEAELILTVGTPMPELQPAVGCGTADFFQVTPSLPAGIVLDMTTGILSGTPNQASGATLYQFQASNPQGSTSTLILITVIPEAPCDLQYPTSEIILTVAQPLSGMIPAVGCGAVDQFTVSPEFPAGLQLDALTGEISGVATGISDQQIHTVVATNATGSTSFSLSLRVDPQAPCQLEYPVTSLSIALGEVLQPLMPSLACGAADDFSINPPLPDGLALDSSTGAISGLALQIHGPVTHLISASNVTGESQFSLTLTVTPVAPCNLSYPATELILMVGDELSDQIPTVGCGQADLFQITPELAPGLALNPLTGVISGNPNEISDETLHQVQASNDQGHSSALLLIAVLPQPPCDLQYPQHQVVLTQGDSLLPLIPDSGCGDATHYSVDPPLPPGLTLDGTSGEISGVADGLQGPLAHVVSASNVSGQSNFTITIEVVLPIPPCFLSYPETEIVLVVGTPMAQLVPSVGCGEADNFHSSPALPPGLLLDPVTGVLSGTAIVASLPTLYSIEATNSQGGSSTLIMITVDPDAPCDLLYPLDDLTLTVGEPMAALIPSVGCGPAENFTVSPPLPAGIEVDSSSGIISGTPQLEAATADHLVTVSNLSGESSFPMTLTVLPQAPCDLSYPLDTLVVEAGVDVGTLQPTLSCGPVDTWQVTPPLPLGMVFDASTGIISGVPLVTHDLQTHFITASNISGSTDFSLDIWIQEVAPCDLVYAESELTLLLGDPMSIPAPVVGCGVADLFEITPALPAGLNFDALSGAIAGIPEDVVALSVYEVEVSNQTGSAVASLSIEVLGQGPCQVNYPQMIIGQPAGVPLDPQIPTVQCGPPDVWVVTPALPPGLVFDPDSGAISGTAAAEGESSHVIRAENSFGSSEVTLQIVIRSIFRFRGGPLEIPYSPVTGEGSGSLSIRCLEGDQNPGFPTPISGVSMALQHDPELFTYTEAVEGSDIALLNGGSGADFFGVNSIDGTILIGVVVSFSMNDFLICFPEIEIAVIDFNAHPPALQGNSVGVTGTISWGNLSGSPPLDNLVAIDGSTSVDPILEAILYQLIPQ